MLTNKFCYVYSRYVIRSIFKVTILNIQMPQFSNPYFFSALNSVSDVPASKIFLIYDYPWRPGGSYNSTYTKSGLPYRQSYNQGITQTGKSVILISYTLTSSEVAFWRRLQSVGNTISKRFDETRVTDGIVKQLHVHLQLSKVYTIHVKIIPCPICLEQIPLYWRIGEVETRINALCTISTDRILQKHMSVL